MTIFRMPKLSIITVNLNNVSGLRKTIKSVVNQTYTDYEYFIIDGGSTDSSVEVIKEYADKITFWISEPDGGIYDAMNKGIKSSSGDVLFFLNSGDLLHDENVIKEVADIIFVNQEYDIYYGNILAKDERTSFISGRNLGSKDFKLGYLPDHQATFIRRNMFTLFGLYNIKYKIFADYDFVLKCFKKHKKFYYLDKIVSVYRLGGFSTEDYSYLILILKYFGLFPFLKARYLQKHLKQKLLKKIAYVISTLRKI